MGLDGIELVMAVEEEFKIVISDADATQCVTVGKLVDYVYSRLRHDSQEPCALQHGFYIVRKEMIRILGISRSRITPEAKLADCIPVKDRRRQWRKLVSAITGDSQKHPDLVYPLWMSRVFVGLMVPLFLAMAVLSRRFGMELGVSIVGALVVAGLITAIIRGLTFPLRREFSTRFTRVWDLVQFVTSLDVGVWSKDEVFQKVRAITVEQLGVKESQVTWDANFVDDLGV